DADVDPQSLDRHRVLRVVQMNRRPADDAGDAVLPHHHARSRQNASIQPADLTETQRAVAIVAGDDHADFVHVRRDHHAQVNRARTPPHGDQVAERIDARILNVVADVPVNQVAHLVFGARDADSFTQFPQDHAAPSFSAPLGSPFCEGRRQPIRSSVSSARVSMNAAISRPARETSRKSNTSDGVCMLRIGMPISAVGTPARLTWMAQASVPLFPGMISISVLISCSFATSRSALNRPGWKFGPRPIVGPPPSEYDSSSLTPCCAPNVVSIAIARSG